MVWCQSSAAASLYTQEFLHSPLNPPPLLIPFLPIPPHVLLSLLSQLSLSGVMCWILSGWIPPPVAKNQGRFFQKALTFVFAILCWDTYLHGRCPAQTCSLSSDCFNFSRRLTTDFVTLVICSDVAVNQKDDAVLWLHGEYIQYSLNEVVTSCWSQLRHLAPKRARQHVTLQLDRKSCLTEIKLFVFEKSHLLQFWWQYKCQTSLRVIYPSKVDVQVRGVFCFFWGASSIQTVWMDVDELYGKCQCALLNLPWSISSFKQMRILRLSSCGFAFNY